MHYATVTGHVSSLMSRNGVRCLVTPWDPRDAPTSSTDESLPATTRATARHIGTCLPGTFTLRLLPWNPQHLPPGWRHSRNRRPFSMFCPCIRSTGFSWINSPSCPATARRDAQTAAVLHYLLTPQSSATCACASSPRPLPPRPSALLCSFACVSLGNHLIITPGPQVPSLLRLDGAHDRVLDTGCSAYPLSQSWYRNSWLSSVMCQTRSRRVETC